MKTSAKKRTETNIGFKKMSCSSSEFSLPRFQSLSTMPYLVTVTCVQSGSVEVWSIGLSDPLPTMPLQLRSPDANMFLDLREAIAPIYDEVAYDLSIDDR